MGFLDSLQGTFNRGTAAAERATRSLRLNQRLNEINKDRQNLAAQLGAILYEETKNDPAARLGRDALYEGIANLDLEREKCQREIAELEAESAAAEEAARTYTCPRCGTTVQAGDLFCSGCGTKVEDIKSEIEAQRRASAVSESGRTCPSCGAVLSLDDVYCVACGAKVSAGNDPVAPAEEVEQLD